MTGKRRKLLAGAMVMALILLSRATTAVPAAAATTFFDGGGAWGGTLSIPRYPCPGGCSSVSFSGYFSGEMNVFDTNHLPMYQAVFPPSASLTMNLQVSLNYSEDCGSLPFVSPVDGFANGTYTITGGTLFQNGTPMGAAQLTGGFAWTRIGTIGLVGTTSMSLENGGGTVLASTAVEGLGLAIMGPPLESVSDMPLPPNCAHEVPVTIAVSGIQGQEDG